MNKALVLFRRRRFPVRVITLFLAGSVSILEAGELSKSDRRWLEREVAALITTEEARIFEELSSKEDRKRFKELFWVRRDPDLMTPENEFKEEFESRVRMTDRRFQRRGQAGSTTDMGKIFLILGFPNSSNWNAEAAPGYSSTSRSSGLGEGTPPSRNSRFADGVPDIPFVNPDYLNMPNDPKLEVNWFYDADPERGIPQRLTLLFRAEPGSPHTLSRTEELEQVLAQVKSSYIVQPDIDYRRDSHGRLLGLPARLDPHSPAKTPLRRMMENGRQETDVSFKTEMAFFRSEQGSYVPVRLEIDPEPLGWKNDVANVTLFGIVENVEGRPISRFEEQVQLARLADGRAVSDIPLYLSAGSYILNLGILDDRSGRTGTRKVPVFVPGFQDEGLQLSSVLVYGGKHETREPPGIPGQAFQFGGTRFLLQSDNTFQTNETLGLFFFAYGFDVNEDEQPSLTGDYIFLKDGQPQGDIIGQPLLGGATQAVASTEIPLADLEPGDYRVQIRVTDHVTGEMTTAEIAFTLKPEPFPIESYSNLVKDYRSGDYSSARRVLSNVRMRSLSSATKKYSNDSSSDDELKSAALLHTEVAILTRNAEATLHLKTARGYLARIKDVSKRKDFERHWYLAVSRHLQVCPAAWGAAPMLDEALEFFPEDDEIRLAVAAAHEAIGSKGVDGELEQAEYLYREILESAPDHAEARLRLGRLLQLQLRSSEALQELRRTLELATEPDLRFLAHLVMGESYDQLGNLSAAIESYRAALGLDPDCQVAAIALSHALHRSGQWATAREVIAGFLDREGASRADGWWRFLQSGTERVEAILEPMREELR